MYLQWDAGRNRKSVIIGTFNMSSSKTEQVGKKIRSTIENLDRIINSIEHIPTCESLKPN